MEVHGLPIPELIPRLIETGVWPVTKKAEQEQELNPILGQSAARKLSPEDTRICLCSPPFATVAEDTGWNPDFWIRQLSIVKDVDPEKTVIIGDFGLGSDSVIVLNYELAMEPRVMYLKWHCKDGAASQSWCCTHQSFRDFCEDVGLTIRNSSGPA